MTFARGLGAGNICWRLDPENIIEPGRNSMSMEVPHPIMAKMLVYLMQSKFLKA